MIKYRPKGVQAHLIKVLLQSCYCICRKSLDNLEAELNLTNGKVKVIARSLEKTQVESVKEQYGAMISDIKTTIESLTNQLKTVKVKKRTMSWTLFAGFMDTSQLGLHESGFLTLTAALIYQYYFDFLLGPRYKQLPGNDLESVWPKFQTRSNLTV